MLQTALRSTVAALIVLVAACYPTLAVTCMNPSLVPSVRVSGSEVCWSAIPGASGYDTVAGLSLNALRNGAAGLAAGPHACAFTPAPATCAPLAYAPPPGDGFYFVVRAERGNSAGSFGTNCPAEVPGRDAAFDTAASCP